jgi:small subunit ribosomal protein S18
MRETKEFGGKPKRDFKKKKDDKGKKKILRKKTCKFSPEEIETIDYKDMNRLRYFVTERGKMIPSRMSGTSAKSQRHLARQVKLARFIALLPYVAE